LTKLASTILSKAKEKRLGLYNLTGLAHHQGQWIKPALLPDDLPNSHQQVNAQYPEIGTGGSAERP